MWNVIFMGTPDFAVGSLQALLEAGQYHIQAVVTQPDRPKGRGQKVVETPVKTFALQHGLPVFQPLQVKEPEFVQKLKEWKPDFIVVAAFGQFLTQEILNIPMYGCINVHGSVAQIPGRRANPVRHHERRKRDRRNHYADGKGHGHRGDVQQSDSAHW